MSAASPIRDALFILGAPRSGTTILQRALAMHAGLWGAFAESHAVFEGPFRPDLAKEESNRVTADRLTPALGEELRRALWRRSMNLSQAFADPTRLVTTGTTAERIAQRARVEWARWRQGATRPAAIHLLEKTPKNTLRVPLLAALVPGARFVFLTRDAGATVDSLIQGWHTWERVGLLGRRKQFATYRMGPQLALSDYHGEWWNFVLIPGWTDLTRRSVPEVAAAQYAACVRTAADDLAVLPADRRLVVSYEGLMARPAEVLARVLAFAQLPMTATVTAFAQRAIAAPRQGKGLRHGAAVEAQRPQLDAADAHLRARLGAAVTG